MKFVIPRIIHQTARDLASQPPEVIENVERIKTLNPDWEHRFYDDTAMREYIKANVSASDMSEIERLNPKYSVILADLFRYLVVYKEGGVYLDIKSAAGRPLSEVIPASTSYILSQWRNRLGERFADSGFYPELERLPGGEFQQWHVISEAGHPFLKAVIDRTLHNIRSYTTLEFGVSSIGVFRVSGPICYSQAIWPIFRQHPVQVVDIEQLGIRYSIYEDSGDTYRYARLSKNHYSKSTEPIFLKPKDFTKSRFTRGNLGELLAQELRDNTDLALKLAVMAFVSTLTFLVGFPIIVWLIFKYADSAN